MKLYRTFFYLILCFGLLSLTVSKKKSYEDIYYSRIEIFNHLQEQLVNEITLFNDELNQLEKEKVKGRIKEIRIKLKAIDLWLRYLHPISYKQINGPLLVEWETEVFEKFEKPYKRLGSGITLAEKYLEEKEVKKDSLSILFKNSVRATKFFLNDSLLQIISKPNHFLYANRLYLLNLSSIYSTGFECPNVENIIPELKQMVKDIDDIYDAFNASFINNSIHENYLQKYKELQLFLQSQSNDYESFNHFEFIKKYINPLYALNQEMLQQQKLVSKSYNDFSLVNNCKSIFDKGLYKAQNAKGIYISIEDSTILNEIFETGKLLFYDPILSANNMRSCASCHKPNEYFNDTSVATHLKFNGTSALERNTPTLVNSIYNHLLMVDGKHISLQNQAKDVITNPNEMNCKEEIILEKVLSCDSYKKTFKKLLKLTPQYDELTVDHITSAISFFYSSFSYSNSLFDDAMNNKSTLTNSEINGFNLFMSKAQCATCHFVPFFNGVKPPFISSEFEVLGVPSTKDFKALSNDVGRYNINPSIEMYKAFRTGSIRNSSYTKPYMHNGVFNTLDEVIDFYNEGGGIGKGLHISNQTLSADSLHLTKIEKESLIAFIKTLDEKIKQDTKPNSLPISKNKLLNNRKVGGIY